MTPPVKLFELTEALEMDSEDSSWWLDRQTGKVFMMESEVMDAVESADEDDEPPEDKLLDWQLEELPAAYGIRDGDPRYLGLPTKFDFHEYRHMERFIGTVAEADKTDQLWRAIKGKGAFRHFKDTAHRLDVIEDWYRYRDAAMNEFMLSWAGVNGIPVDRSPRGPVQP